MGWLRNRIYKGIGKDYVAKLVKATGNEVKEAYVIGSVASGKADPGTHDVDLAIVVKNTDLVRSKAQELKQEVMTELSSIGKPFTIDYHLFSQEDITQNPDVIHNPKKLIYKTKE